jgi:hypothetical protein
MVLGNGPLALFTVKVPPGGTGCGETTILVPSPDLHSIDAGTSISGDESVHVEAPP